MPTETDADDASVVVTFAALLTALYCTGVVLIAMVLIMAIF